MQRVAAYLLERAGHPQSPQAGKKEGNQIRAVIENVAQEQRLDIFGRVGRLRRNRWQRRQLPRH